KVVGCNFESVKGLPDCQLRLAGHAIEPRHVAPHPCPEGIDFDSPLRFSDCLSHPIERDQKMRVIVVRPRVRWVKQDCLVEGFLRGCPIPVVKSAYPSQSSLPLGKCRINP